MDCIFCKIVAGLEISSKLYEDNKILALMNNRPINPGEFIVIPKEHIEHFIDIPDELAAHILIKAQKFARNVYYKLKPKRVGYVVHGFGVPHAHLNVVPLNYSAEIVTDKAVKIENGNIIYDENQIQLAKREELDLMAKIIRE